MDDAERLPEFFHAAEVAIVAVAVDADGDVELDLVVCVIWLGFADVPGHSAASEHDAGEGHVEGFGCGNDAYAFRSSNPDAIVGEEFFGLVYAVTELCRPLVDVVEKANRQILCNPARSHVGGMQSSTGDTLVELLHRLLVLSST